MENIEKKFDEFLESESCDHAGDAFYNAIKSAFLAGWIAAGKENPYKNKADGKNIYLSLSIKLIKKMRAGIDRLPILY